MTEHEFFKMLNNIDDQLVAEAKQTSDLEYDPENVLYGDTKPLKLGAAPQSDINSDLYGGNKPLEIKPKRRSIWKTFIACAACFMAVGIAIGVLTAMNRGRNNLIDDTRSGASGSGSSYDLSNLESFAYGIADVVSPANFFELAKGSDLIVLGTFVEDGYQDSITTESLEEKISLHSYNALRIDEVYKGDVEVGSKVVVSGDYFVNDGRIMYIYGDISAAMVKGEQWVYFLNWDVYCYSGVGFVVSEMEYKSVFVDDFILSNRPAYEHLYPDVQKMLEKDPSVLRMISIAHEGKIYNTIGYKDCDGVKLLVGTAKAQFELGEYVEVIGVVENATDEQIALFKNNSGYDNQEISTSIYKDDRDLIDADTVESIVSFGSSRYVIQPGETYFQPMRFSTYKEYDYNIHEFLDEYVPIGIYKGASGIRLLRGEGIDSMLSSDIKHYGVGYEIEIIDGTGKNSNRRTITHDGVTYIVVGSSNIGGVKFLIGTKSYKYNAGEYAEIIAVVENTTDKPIGLLMPNSSVGLHNQVVTTLVNGDYSLKDEGPLDPLNSGSGISGIKTAETSFIIQPGEIYYQPMRFSTYNMQYRPEDTVIPDYVPLGSCKGTAAIRVLDDLNNAAGGYVTDSLNFEIEIVNILNSYRFDMEEFPNVSFSCKGNTLYAEVSKPEWYMTELYWGNPIRNVYLIDLNGDGKREICSTVERGSDVVDQRIMAYDFENRKLYELSYRRNYDYHIEIVKDSEDTYSVYAVKSLFGTDDMIDRTPLTLDIMREINMQEYQTEDAYKGVTELEREISGMGTSPAFEMEEFPDDTFTIEETAIKVTHKDGTVNTLLYLFEGPIERVYLADLNGDGNREIAAEYYDVPYVSPGQTPASRKVLSVIDLKNNRSLHFSMSSTDSDYTFTVENDQLYLMIDGVTEPNSLTLYRFEQLGVTTAVW